MLSGRVLGRERWEYATVERDRIVSRDAAFVQHRVVDSKIVRELEVRLDRFIGKNDLIVLS